MPETIKRLRHQMILAEFAAMLVISLPLAKAGLAPGVNRLDGHPASTLWRVKYMGGPEQLKRGTHVQLTITAQTISYRPAGSGSENAMSIRTAAVTDVSDAVIDGDRSEKIFGPDEPDFVDDLGAPCARQALKVDTGALSAAGAAGCLAGTLGLEIPFAVLKSILENIPFHDRFVRIAWEQDGIDPHVVFQVSGKDFVALREELERVTDNGHRPESRVQTIQDDPFEMPVTGIESVDRRVQDARFQRWLNERCPTNLGQQPAWLKQALVIAPTRPCPAATGINDPPPYLRKSP